MSGKFSPSEKQSSDLETWTAYENLTMTGMDMRCAYSGMTMLHGWADVEFTNGQQSFTKTFEVISVYSEGLFLSLGTNISNTKYIKAFKKESSKQDIIESYEGIFATQGVSLSFSFLGISLGSTFGVDQKTKDIAENGWKGKTNGCSASLGDGIPLPKGLTLNIGTQITVYRDPDNPENEFINRPDWFYYKKIVPTNIKEMENYKND